jgi:hypothetical protein
MFLMDALYLGDQGNINFASVNPVALAMSNVPIALIVLTAGFQWYFMAYIPFFSGDHFHIAKMA